MINNNLNLFEEEQPAAWAEVILPLALPQTYTYSIPFSFLTKAKEGARAEVIFGTNKKYAGIIKSISSNKPEFSTRQILNVLDEEPILYPQQLQFWNWLSRYYMCSEGEVMSAALPANFKLSSETILIFNEEAGDDFTHLNDKEYLVAEALLIRKQLNITEVQQILDVVHVYPVVKNLIEKNICFIWEELAEKYKPRIEKFVELHSQFNNDDALSELLNNWKGAPRQMELLLALIYIQKTEGEVSQTALLKKSGATPAQLKGLEQKGIVQISSQAVDRIRQMPGKIDIQFTLSNKQQEAYASIYQHFEDKRVCLLHGVTGSGKTEIYVKLIADLFEKGKQVLYLLPEIALTAQIIRRLQKHFGGHIAVYHSKFNNNERIELWRKIRTGEVKIVLGARSALFLPFRNLGLIIVDEEHDTSYKQMDPAPRYHARDAAIYYASLFNANVLLGTATPSLESYFNAQRGKYGLVELLTRFGEIELPGIEIVNMAGEGKKGQVILSKKLADAIKETANKKKQTILFKNRRGYHPLIICGSCGHIPKCKHCDVSLTLHKYSNKMHCHYCGSTYPKLIACPQCGMQNWLEKNFGTEKLEEQIETAFPNLRVSRMDFDSVKGKTAHDNLILQFEHGKIDVLVGTQMVVKGLDFEHVELVGILDADGLMSFADFRVNERAFQLMEQVSGRAGRKHNTGKVVIQAYNVQHPVLKYVLTHNYPAFYKEEIESRKLFAYPPFARIIKLVMKHKDRDRLNSTALALTKLLYQDLSAFLFGPAAPVVGRVRNQYILELMIKVPAGAAKMENVKQAVKNHIQMLFSNKEHRPVNIYADVDPV